eukprot:m.310315 g.310315  ORF g.310315 m.310315 type:complete len:63 (-) comp15949_c0_seq6:3074-3262(-)
MTLCVAADILDQSLFVPKGLRVALELQLQLNTSADGCSHTQVKPMQTHYEIPQGYKLNSRCN